MALWGCSSGGIFGRSNIPDIWQAVRDEDIASIRAYAAGGGDLDTGARRKGVTPLLYALQLGKRDSYTSLLEVGANPNTFVRSGQSLMHHAAGVSDPFWLEQALAHEGDPNLMNRAEGLSRGTPMLMAIAGEEGGIAENVRMLLKAGARIDAPIDYRDRTALAVACVERKFEIVYMLLESGANYLDTGPRDDSFIITMTEREAKDAEWIDGPEGAKWCTEVWKWLDEHGIDPYTAEWDGEQWKLK